MNIKRIITTAMLTTVVFLTICGCGNNKSDKSKSIESIEVSEEIAVVNVVNKTLADAETSLKNAGFTNITTNVDSNANKTEWVVTEQSVEAGQLIHAEDSIELTCALKCKLFIDVTSEGNFFLNKYDIIISLDGEELGSVSNGKEFTHLEDVLSGKHELIFCKAGDPSVKSTRPITVSGNMTYACDLAHDSDSIDIKNESIKDDVGDSELEVIDVTGMVLSEAIEKLSSIGFSNIREEPYSDIWDKDNWLVTSQNVAAGTVMSKADFIQLDCISLDDYFSNTYVGKNIEEIQKLADAGGFSIRFEDEDFEDLSEKISTMDKETKSNWIASEARRYGGADKTAVVTVYNSDGYSEGSEIEEPEKTDESDKNDEEEDSKDSEESTQEIKVPIMAGTNIDTVTDEAKECGLTQRYGDEDFDHGTKMRPLSSSNDGLRLDIVYSSDTKEILCANIVTLNGFSTADEQKDLVVAMSGVLCPINDKDEVVDWVESNVGNTAETTVNGFVYEIGLGPTGNIIYSAGNRNWEEWMLSLD